MIFMQNFFFKDKLKYNIFLNISIQRKNVIRTLCFAEKDGQVIENGVVVWI